MRTRFIAALFAVATAATLAADAPKPAAQAKPKPTKKSVVVVAIDMNKIKQDSQLAQRLGNDLTAAENALRTQMQPKIQEFQQKRQAFNAAPETMPASEKESKGKELQAMQQDLMAMQDKAKGDMQAKQEAAIKYFTETLKGVVEKLAKENGWDFTINKSEDISLWTSEAVDQTDIVLERLNALPIPSPLPTAAAAAPKVPEVPVTQAIPLPAPAQQPPTKKP
jgi:Skp family chaperone for outer membrane proteins